jgi:hypothetical protein
MGSVRPALLKEEKSCFHAENISLRIEERRRGE